MTDTLRYVSPSALTQMSHAEREAYMDSLSEAGLDGGPEWDALYAVWEAFND